MTLANKVISLLEAGLEVDSLKDGEDIKMTIVQNGATNVEIKPYHRGNNQGVMVTADVSSDFDVSVLADAIDTVYDNIHDAEISLVGGKLEVIVMKVQ